ncbi:hypothetical protein H9L21_10630 [Aeromicrobium senzhongii]|uniref:Uncharacterized protein n=1 Tax=Aeromicrobium senzhongii TaxID=2663859 RepID=A0ABX6SS55_9ACTN|nr:hypothetical protein [Aeromicrobium senzhongii]MTB89167.1 hypothetical protein [Aeromicrobium senzhongii]QNL93565.1 hypothetical protein H9L21_10630 [Aeromicrobium senzhongii]
MRLSSPYPLVIAATVVGLQACVFIVLAVLDLGGLVEGRVGVGIGIGVMLLLVGVGLAAAAVGLLRGAPVSRGPVVVAQLIGLGLAWSLRNPDPNTGDNRAVALAIAASAVVVLGCLATGSARKALGDDPSQ